MLQGEEARPSKPEEFARFIRAEIDRYSQLVKRAGIKVE